MVAVEPLPPDPQVAGGRARSRERDRQRRSGTGLGERLVAADKQLLGGDERREGACNRDPLVVRGHRVGGHAPDPQTVPIVGWHPEPGDRRLQARAEPAAEYPAHKARRDGRHRHHDVDRRVVDLLYHGGDRPPLPAVPTFPREEPRPERRSGHPDAHLCGLGDGEQCLSPHVQAVGGHRRRVEGAERHVEWVVGVAVASGVAGACRHEPCGGHDDVALGLEHGRIAATGPTDRGHARAGWDDDVGRGAGREREREGCARRLRRCRPHADHLEERVKVLLGDTIDPIGHHTRDVGERMQESATGTPRGTAGRPRRVSAQERLGTRHDVSIHHRRGVHHPASR